MILVNSLVILFPLLIALELISGIWKKFPLLFGTMFGRLCYRNAFFILREGFRLLVIQALKGNCEDEKIMGFLN